MLLLLSFEGCNLVRRSGLNNSSFFRVESHCLFIIFRRTQRFRFNLLLPPPCIHCRPEPVARWLNSDQRGQTVMQGLSENIIVPPLPQLPQLSGLLSSNYFLTPSAQFEVLFSLGAFWPGELSHSLWSLNSNHCLAESYRDFIQFKIPTNYHCI